MALHLHRASKNPAPGLNELLLQLGDGETGFGGTPFGRGEGTLDDLLQSCIDCEDPAKVPPGWVQQTTFWMIESDTGQAVGALRLRHRLNDALLQAGGHIGYYVDPAHRGKGYATRALRLALDELRALGASRALLTASPDNLPSIRVIIANGGVQDGQGVEQHWGYIVNRYWINL